MNPSSPDPAAAAATAIAAANATLADYQQIRIWLIWPDPDFPRTATDKPRQPQIAQKATQLLATTTLGTPISRLAPLTLPLPSPTHSPSLNSTLSHLLTRYSHSPTTSLEQNLNLSSLDRVELLTTLESQFHVELNESALAQAKTISDLQNLLTQPQSKQTQHIYPTWSQSKPIRALRQAVYYALIWPATQILAHPKILGRENLATVKGPALIVSNHITRRADIGLILLALPPRLRHNLATAMGGETLQQMRRPPREWWAPKRAIYQLNYWLVTALFNVFPLPQFSGFRESFRFAGESADRGYSLLVFPEGVVNDTPTAAWPNSSPALASWPKI